MTGNELFDRDQQGWSARGFDHPDRCFLPDLAIAAGDPLRLALRVDDIESLVDDQRIGMTLVIDHCRPTS